MIEWILLAIIILLQVLDAATTLSILKLGGRELNPMLKWLMDRLGVVPALAVSKLVLVGGVAVVAMLAENTPALKVLLYLVAMIFAFVCANNIQVWKNLKR
jgi:hypothetical protein